MFDREKWVDAIGQIDEKYMVEYYDRKLGRKGNKKKQGILPVWKWFAGIAAAVLIGVVSIFAYKTITGPRGGSGDDEFWSTHKRYYSFMDARRELGDGFLLYKFSDADFSEVMIDIGFTANGGVEDKNTWTKLECYMDRNGEERSLIIYFPCYSGEKGMYHLKKDSTETITVNNIKAFYSVYGKDEGYSREFYSLIVYFELEGRLYWYRYFNEDPITDPEAEIRKLLE